MKNSIVILAAGIMSLSARVLFAATVSDTSEPTFVDTTLLSARTVRAALPEGYAPVDGVASTSGGKQWINTGYVPVCTDRIEFKVRIPTLTTLCVYCSRTDGKVETFTCFMTDKSGYKFRFDRNDDADNGYSSQVLSAGAVYEVLADGSTCKCTLNGVPSASMKSGSFTPRREVTLFASYPKDKEIATANLTNFAVLEMYYFRVTDKDGNVKVDMVPCVRASDGSVGLYDLAGRKDDNFYPSQGTSAFKAATDGVNVSSPVRIYQGTAKIAYSPLYADASASETSHVVIYKVDPEKKSEPQVLATCEPGDGVYDFTPSSIVDRRASILLAAYNASGKPIGQPLSANLVLPRAECESSSGVNVDTRANSLQELADEGGTAPFAYDTAWATDGTPASVRIVCERECQDKKGRVVSCTTNTLFTSNAPALGDYLHELSNSKGGNFTFRCMFLDGQGEPIGDDMSVFYSLPFSRGLMLLFQ